MKTIDAREATSFVVGRLRENAHIFVVYEDERSIGYSETPAVARFYARSLAEKKLKKIKDDDQWSEVHLEELDGRFVILKRTLGRVYNSAKEPVGTVRYERVNLLDMRHLKDDKRDLNDDEQRSNVSSSESSSESDSSSSVE